MRTRAHSKDEGHRWFFSYRAARRRKRRSGGHPSERPSDVIRKRANFRVAFKFAMGLFIGVLGMSGSLLAQPSITPKANFWKPDGPVYAMVVTNGLVYLGGEFDYVGPGNEGYGWVDLVGGAPAAGLPSINGTVNTVVPDGKGGWYVGGKFTEVGGIDRTNAVHLFADFSVDEGWAPNPVVTYGGGEVINVILVSGNTVYLGGRFNQVQDQSRGNLAAVDASTGVPTPWNPNANNMVSSLAISGTTIYGGGQFTSIGGKSRARIAALDTTVNTGQATDWDPHATGGSLGVLALVIDGTTIYVGGDFTSIGGKPRNRIAALDATVNANQATSWNPNANDTVQVLAMGGGYVYAGGDFTSIGGRSRDRIAALDPSTGGALGTWDPSASGTVNSLVVTSNLVYAGGHFATIAGLPRRSVAALDTTTGAATDWSPQTSSLSPSAIPTVLTLVVATNGVFVGGDFTSIGGLTRNGVVALSVATGAATDWDPNANDTVYSLAATTNVVYVGGSFTQIGGTNRDRLAEVDAGTGQALDWNPDVTGQANTAVYAIASIGNTVYVGGRFNKVGTTTRNNLAAIDSQTGQATDWNPSADGIVRVIAPVGQIVYVGGEFYNIGGQARRGIAVIGAVDGTATDWNASSDNAVRTLVVVSNIVYVGGDFNNIGGEVRNHAASLDRTSALATIWNPDAGVSTSYRVYSLAPFLNTVYAGGAFTQIGGEFRSRIALLDTVMGAALSWDPNCNNSVRVMVPTRDTVYVGGEFTQIGGEPNPYFAAFSTAPRIVPETFVKDPDTGTVTFTLTTGNGLRLRIQASPDLNNWSDIHTNLNIGSPLDFSDPDAASATNRFYRAVLELEP